MLVLLNFLQIFISSVFLLHSILMIGFTFAVIEASWKILCDFQAPVTISVLWEWISWSHLKIFGLCGEKGGQTSPNGRQLCCAVSQKILCLHYSTIVPFLPHGACQTVEAHVTCGSSVYVTGGVIHGSLCSTLCICTRLVPLPFMSSR